MNLLSQFAAGEEPHISLAAEEIGTVGDFVITNTTIYSVLLAVFMVVFFTLISRKMSIKPQRGVIAFVEMLFEYLIKMMTGVFGNRKQAIKFLPVFAVYFTYIVFSNVSGLLPWIGGVTGGPEAIPLFRPFTADINGVLAMATFAIVAVQVLSVREQGLANHLKHYFSDKPFNPINIFVGLLEMLGEVTRILSLTLRLFLNTVIGEILVTVFIFISGPATPITLVPIIVFELLVAYIQAYVFTVLASTYLSMAIAHHGDHDDHHEETAPLTPSQNPVQAATAGAKG